MIIYCPNKNCEKLLIKGFDELAMVAVDFSFTMRCSNCREQVELTVRTVKQIEHTIGRKRPPDPPPDNKPPAEAEESSRVVFVGE